MAADISATILCEIEKESYRNDLSKEVIKYPL